MVQQSFNFHDVGFEIWNKATLIIENWLFENLDFTDRLDFVDNLNFIDSLDFVDDRYCIDNFDLIDNLDLIEYFDFKKWPLENYSKNKKDLRISPDSVGIKRNFEN